MKKSKSRKKKPHGVRLPLETKSWDAIKRDAFRRKCGGGKSR
jgi:hypothetical protein